MINESLKPRLSAAETATLRLRGLYEQFGYQKYQVSQFEEYSLYLRFSSFLTGSRILSFTDLDGRLLALKPDVTLSIAKNLRLDGDMEKAYYIENVYRESISSGTIKEISQMGLEYLGGNGAYAQAEVLHLAHETLAAIGPAYVLEVSHMGFIMGLFEALGLEGATREAIMRGLSAKSPHSIELTARDAGIGAFGVNVLTELCRLSGNFAPTLEKARAMCLNNRMTAALDELEQTAKAVGCPLRLDFTLQGDMEYYDGLMMAGYLDGVPNAVLSGGRYDGLMKKLGHDLPAVGFALYLDDLKRLPRTSTAADVDVFLLTKPEDDPASIFSAVRELTEQGLRVRTGTEKPQRLTCGKYFRFYEGGLVEC